MSSVSLQSPGTPELNSTAALTTLAVALTLSGFCPQFFDLLYIVIFLISAFLGLLQPLASPIIGVYVLVGVWLVRSWIIPGLLLLSVIEISQIAIPPNPGLQVIGTLFGSGMTIALGLAIRYFRIKTARANTQAEHTRQQALLTCLVIREAATNILKYAPAESTASLEVTREPDGAITISTSNLISDTPTNIGITGGFGLANLEHQITTNGGELEYSHNHTRWILWALIPTNKRTQT